MRLALVLAIFAAAAPAFAADAWVDARYEHLEGKPRAELRLLRNEIFARHGRSFSSEDLRRYFAQQPWYKPDPRYSDAALPKEQRDLVDRIEALEKGLAPVDEARRSIETALGKIKKGAGIPESVGNVVVGKQAPAEPSAATFLGLPGTLGPLLSTQGDVVWVAFELGTHGGWEDSKTKDALVELLRKQVGSAPAEELGGLVWRDQKRALRLIDTGAGEDARYHLVVHVEDPAVPGSAGDGFEDFLKSLGDGRTRARLTEAGHYSVEIGTSALDVERVQDKWIVTGSGERP